MKCFKMRRARALALLVTDNSAAKAIFSRLRYSGGGLGSGPVRSVEQLSRRAGERTPSLALPRRTGGGENTWALGINLLITSSLAVGCSLHQPAGTTLVQSPVYATPAADLLKRVQAVVAAPPISLPAEDLGNGVLLTTWQEGLRGDFHIVRYWHERTRYRITVAPDFTDPAHRSRLQVADETQQRPDESGINVAAKTWSDAPNIRRTERSDALLKQIESQLVAPAPVELPATTLPAK